MPRVTRLLAASLFVATAVQAQSEGGLLSGFTIRLHGGLDHMAGLSTLNDQIHSMNSYFGAHGTWVQDAQGENVQVQWAPYLKIADLANRPDMGLTVEKDLLKWERSRLVVGMEYTGGAASTSNLFEFTPGTGFRASVFAKESVEVKNIMASCRYSVKDANLPLHGHVGLGVGMGDITAAGIYIQHQTIQSDTDPMFGELAAQHVVQADYDGSALTGRLFVGAEVELGPMSLLLDMGYNYMNFGKLDGSTTQSFRDLTGVMEAMPVENAPGTRYEFAPLISAGLQRARDNAIALALGLPVDTSPIDLNDPSLHLGAPATVDYDLSGGFVRLSVGYRF
jgi:hypothetical protein